MDIASLVGGLGIGSVLTLFLKEYFDSRKTVSRRLFEEKRAAYVNYLEIRDRTQALSEKEAVWAIAAASERVKLSGSADVLEKLETVINLPPNSPRVAIDELVLAMRNDLFPQVK